MTQEFVRQRIFIPNGEGWELELTRRVCPDTFQENKRPVLMLPGLGNNNIIFKFPNEQQSWVATLARSGLEVWTANLRGQGASRFLGRRKNLRIRIKDLAITDLGMILEYITYNSSTTHAQIDVIGASLGGVMTYVHTVLHRDNHIGSIVSVGSPFRWEECHPLVALAMSQPRLVGMVPLKGSRSLLKHTFPFLQKFPGIIKPYIQPHFIAGDEPEDLLPAVDDTNSYLAIQMAKWINAKDLIVEGVNITTGMQNVTNPLFCVTGNNDGIVPPPTSLAAIAASGSPVKDVLWVGDEKTPFGHTDPMIHKEAPQRVFQPITQWLQGQP